MDPRRHGDIRSSPTLVIAAVVAAWLLSAAPASADVFGFSCISDNNPADCAILESQLMLTVTAGSDSLVNFLFTNTGPAASSITDVYFDDLPDPLLSTPAVITDSGESVQFSSGCSPGNLPGGNPYGFASSYCADSDAPTQPNGVNPGEWLNIAYTLIDPAQFSDVIAAINAGDYRVGVKVQGFAGGGSESGITGIPPTTPVPEPGTLLLVGVGSVLAGFVRRRRNTSHARR